jgi:hypothetical protein
MIRQFLQIGMVDCLIPDGNQMVEFPDGRVPVDIDILLRFIVNVHHPDDVSGSGEIQALTHLPLIGFSHVFPVVQGEGARLPGLRWRRPELIDVP